MYDKASADKFINSLFDSMMPHLERVRNDSAGNLSAVAIDFMETNEDSHRITYAAIKSRINTVKSVCAAMLADEGVNQAVRARIYTMFPELKPVEAFPPAGKPA